MACSLFTTWSSFAITGFLRGVFKMAVFSASAARQGVALGFRPGLFESVTPSPTSVSIYQTASRALGDSYYYTDDLRGFSLTYQTLGGVDSLVGGTITGFKQDVVRGSVFDWTVLDVQGLSIPVTAPVALNAPALWNLVLGGNDQIIGSLYSDYLSGFGGEDTINGGAGDDVIDGGAGPNYLRGDEGNDNIKGAAGFDDINGNQGNDTASGGLGDDWVVGGKDDDLLYGEDGADAVYGNMGNDTCEGGAGVDWVRGGQGNDVVIGGAGADFLAGDRGNDTVTGGSGADIFYFFAGADADRITDFSRAEGDRIMLDHGAAYTVAQVGADAVVTVGGASQVVLVGVSISSLTGGWIFEG